MQFSSHSNKRIASVYISGKVFCCFILCLVTGIPQICSQTPSLDHMIGQMLMVGFRGLEVDETHPVVRDIRDHHIGGVVLFDKDVAADSSVRNIQSAEQLRTLVHDLQSFASTPLFVAIDCEGGLVNRLKEAYGFAPTVSAQFLGQRDDLSLTLAQADTVAATLAGLGINVNLAPVVDLNVNPDNPVIGSRRRSFSAEPDVVVRHALVFIKAHHRQNVLTTLKHFPGHGSSDADSHLGMVDVTAMWTEAELEPYRRIIQTGETDIVMTAHVYNARLDSLYPATLSKRIITGILREDLGFDGVVITDDLQMKAVTDEYGFRTVVRSALDAGADMLVFANNMVYGENITTQVIGIIKDLIDAGTITPERIEASYRRIMKLKNDLQPQ